MSPAPPVNPSILVVASSTSAVTFFAHDGTDARFHIRGRIDTYTDSLTFRILTRVLSTGERSAIPAEALFDAMMAHFGGQPGGMPAVLRGVWDDTDPAFVTNLARFNAALLAGCDETAAAVATFTGRMAVKYNYPVVVLGVTDPPTGPPPYRKVNVYFKR